MQRLLSAILLATLGLSGLPVAAGVVWLELGAAGDPARGPDGAVLDAVSLADLRLKVYDRRDAILGTADIAGLDEIGPGHFAGAVSVGEGVAGPVVLRLASGSDGMTAEIGTVRALADAFEPDAEGRGPVVAVTSLTWEVAADHQLRVSPSGFGNVPGVGPVQVHGAVVQLVPVAHPWWEFRAWGGDVPSGHEGDVPLELTMDTDRALTAIFDVAVPAVWLLAHFGPMAIDLDGDPDADGFSTREEYANGSDPLTRSETQIQVDLRAGWNHLALAVQPDRHLTVAEALSGNVSEPAQAWNPWRQHYEQVTRPRAQKGLWVYAPTPVAGLSVTGHTVIDGSFRAYAGWNSGGPVDGTPLAAEAGLSFPVWYWQAARRLLLPHVAGDTPVPGEGLWMFLAADEMLWDGE